MYVGLSSTGEAKEGDALVSEQAMELDDEFIFLLCEVAALEVGPEVVDPPEPAALPAPKQACTNKHGSISKSWVAAQDGMLERRTCSFWE